MNNVLIPGRLPDFTPGQQLFVLQQLALGLSYTAICDAFVAKYPSFAAAVPSETVSKRLYDRVRKLKSAKSEEIAQLASELPPRAESIRSKDATYRFALLDKMLHETPDTEVIYTTPDGVEKIQCNRAIKVKIIELMEKIEGTFDKDEGYLDGKPAGWTPPMVLTDAFGSAESPTQETKQINPPPATEE